MPYQMTVGIAEERIREDRKEGSRISSEDDLVRRLRQLLPGWDIDVPTTARGETQDEVVGNWGRPGLIVQHYPALRQHSSAAGSDALAAIAPPEGMHESERLLMFAYQDIGVLTEMVVLHEVAHVLSFDFNAGHSERWLDIYLDLLDKAGLREAKNTISFMTGKMEMKFEVVEGSRQRQSALYKPESKRHFRNSPYRSIR